MTEENVKLRVTIKDKVLNIVVQPDTDIRLIRLSVLDFWAGWSQVESDIKAMVKASGPLTNEEWQVIRSCATTQGGKHGLAEFEQAYRQMI